MPTVLRDMSSFKNDYDELEKIIYEEINRSIQQIKTAEVA